jgi:hypothetical protein
MSKPAAKFDWRSSTICRSNRFQGCPLWRPRFNVTISFRSPYMYNRLQALDRWTPISCCAPRLLSYSYYLAYIPPTNCFQGGGIFWILSDSNVSLEEQIWLTECIYLADYFKLWKKKEKTEWNVFFNHMVGMKTTGEQISILCHNGTIFDKPREKLDWPPAIG